MKFSEKDIWKVIDGEVTPAQHTAFLNACEQEPKLHTLYHHLLKMHEQLKAFFQVRGNTADRSSVPLTPVRLQDPTQN